MPALNTAVYSIIDKIWELHNLMIATASSFKVSIPRLKPDEIKGLQDFWKVYESHPEEIRAELLRRAGEHPEFRFILQSAQSEQSAEQQDASLELQRRAVCQGEWEPYLKNLQLQGMHYARAGLSFHAWIEIVAAFRQHLAPHLLAAYGKSAERLLSAINGVDALIEIILSVIGDSYLETKELLSRIERKRDEDALRGNEARKAAILNSGLDAVITIDHQGRVMEFNPAAQKIFGYHRDEVLGREMSLPVIELFVATEEDMKANLFDPAIVSNTQEALDFTGDILKSQMVVITR
jgi:PAS domain S-box-containing protein